MKNTLKKFSIFTAIVFFVSLATAFLNPKPISAADYIPKRSNEASCYFLGLTCWDEGVEITDQESLKNGIWLIAANILTDITVIASYLVLGYVIYGGYLYTFSGGDPTKVAKGRKTLAQAFIGLAIVLSATAIMSTIRAVIFNTAYLDTCATKTCVTPAKAVTRIINWFIAIAGIVSAVFVVYGGISYMTSAGDPGKLEKAKKMILYALIGLAVVGLSTAITTFVSSRIEEANENAYLNTIIISKEDHEIQHY